MATIPHEIFPISANAEILAFCQQLVPEAEPILVPIYLLSESRENECFDNVERYIQKYGGERILGWQLMRWANIMIEAQAHAIWRSPTGELLDISPCEQSSSLFLPDLNMKYNGYPIGNIRQALTDSPLVSTLIDMLTQHDKLRSSVKSGEEYEISWDLHTQINKILFILRNTDVGRNSPCPCQSGLKFKKCCGRVIGENKK